MTRRAESSTARRIIRIESSINELTNTERMMISFRRSTSVASNADRITCEYLFTEPSMSCALVRGSGLAFGFGLAFRIRIPVMGWAPAGASARGH